MEIIQIIPGDKNGSHWDSNVLMPVLGMARGSLSEDLFRYWQDFLYKLELDFSVSLKILGSVLVLFNPVVWSFGVFWGESYLVALRSYAQFYAQK